MNKAAALALLLALAPAAAMPRKPRMDKSMETDGTYCKVATPGHRLIETPEQWAELWDEAIGKRPPPLDLSKSVAVAAFAGMRNSGGYAIVFDPVKEQDGTLLVRYTVTRPKGMAIMALTQPWSIKVFPKTKKKIVIEGRDE